MKQEPKPGVTDLVFLHKLVDPKAREIDFSPIAKIIRHYINVVVCIEIRNDNSVMTQPIATKDIELFVRAVSEAHKLKTLMVDGVYFSTVGGKNIFQLLCKLSLKCFALIRCKLDEMVVEELARAVALNPSIEDFATLSDCNLLPDDYEILAKALRSNTNIQYLSLYDHVMTRDAFEDICVNIVENFHSKLIHFQWGSCTWGIPSPNPHFERALNYVRSTLDKKKILQPTFFFKD